MRKNGYTIVFFCLLFGSTVFLNGCFEKYGNPMHYQNKADFAQKIVSTYQSMLVGYEKHGLLTDARRQVIGQQMTEWSNYQTKLLALVVNTKRPVVDTVRAPELATIPPLAANEKISDMSAVFLAQCHVNREDEKTEKYLAINFDHDDTHSPFLPEISAKMTNEIDSAVCDMVRGILYVEYKHEKKMHSLTVTPNFSIQKNCGEMLDTFNRSEVKMVSDTLLTPIKFKFEQILPEKDKLKAKVDLQIFYFLMPSPYFKTENAVASKPKNKKRN